MPYLIGYGDGTNKHLWSFKIIIYYIHTFLHVSATPEAILTEVHYKGYTTEISEPKHKCKVTKF